MQVKIKLFDTTLPLPAYKTPGAAAFDLYARVTTTILPRQVGYVPLNVALQLPPGYWALVSARSSLHKRGLLLANGIGVGDHDYRGNHDEYQAALLNFTDQPVTIEAGDRIVQMMVLAREPVQFELVSEFVDSRDRGGFGSTGSR